MDPTISFTVAGVNAFQTDSSSLWCSKSTGRQGLSCNEASKTTEIHSLSNICGEEKDDDHVSGDAYTPCLDLIRT